MELAGPASTAGSGFTKTLTVSEEEHPLASVPVTMYCVESVGPVSYTHLRAHET